MRIGGLVKNTALDFPGILGAVVFTQGCNFTCPYCHNPHLVRFFGLPVSETEVMEFLRKRRGLLDGLVISGGEPTLQPDLAEFCKKTRGLGYLVKVDTNGSRPEVIADLIERGLINYVALDLKTDPRAYPAELSPTGLGDAIIDTVNILKRSSVAHEFRVTAAAPFINPASMEALARAAAGEAPLYIQKYRPDNILSPDYMSAYEQPSPSDLESLREIASPYLPCLIR
ncbi:anaerobic ribonucleoside-triphosphate reductase activating protein [Deltaproteobacteria bacterium Smac51]|nr:anaerobic ribonucleoside-triphosphate reductase activating protein [Deltaproteobacteria bacterium Smac51]